MIHDSLPQRVQSLALEAPNMDAQIVRETTQRRHRTIRYVVRRSQAVEDTIALGLAKDLSCAMKAIAVVSVLRGVFFAARTIAGTKDREVCWPVVLEEGVRSALVECVMGVPLAFTYVGLRSWGRWTES